MPAKAGAAIQIARRARSRLAPLAIADIVVVDIAVFRTCRGIAAAAYLLRSFAFSPPLKGSYFCKSCANTVRVAAAAAAALMLTVLTPAPALAAASSSSIAYTDGTRAAEAWFNHRVSGTHGNNPWFDICDAKCDAHRVYLTGTVKRSGQSDVGFYSINDGGCEQPRVTTSHSADTRSPIGSVSAAACSYLTPADPKRTESFP
jgi:hypothetical protein